MPTPADARSCLDDVLGRDAWAIIRRKAAGTAGLLGGVPHSVESLLDIELPTGVPAPGRTVDRLVAVPFRQLRERGFAAHDDGAPLVVVDVTAEHEVAVDDLLAVLPRHDIAFTEVSGFDTSDAEYGDLVDTIITEEVGRGQGANLVIGRHFRAVVADWSPERALSVYRRLLERERGAYWTFCFFTGERFLIGATPERHVSVRGGNVRMNPISGTFRLGDGRDVERRLLEFLADEKEIYELFMVVDEELKMMCDLCHEGGQVLGPFLKPMTHLVHTEYLLAGRSERDPREILRDTMYAATVTGSPVENACRLITEYEPEGRGYYGAAVAIFGRDEAGEPTLDSPIVIRTADVATDGRLKVTAGTTLVRDSVAADEVAETHAKAGGILSAFGLVPAAPPPPPGLSTAELARDEDVLLALAGRNQRLSRFWLTDQSDASIDPRLAGRRVLILDLEDDFVKMLRHVLQSLGMEVAVLRHERYAPGALAGYDLVIVGPGPGDPRDLAHPKIAAARAAIAELRASGQPFLAVCLGHQVLCGDLGIEVTYKDIVFQGTQSPVEIDGRVERMGFYNTFVGRLAGAAAPEGVTVEADPDSGDIHLLRGAGFVGIQFHAESILSENGYDLLHRLVASLVAPA